MPQPDLHFGADNRTCKICGRKWNKHNDVEKSICWKELQRLGWSNTDFR
jgi:hypothetical protein